MVAARAAHVERGEIAQAPTAKSGRPQRDRLSANPQPEHNAPNRRRVWLRRILYALLPLILIGLGYWYVTGGAVVSTEDAYIDARKVGISTDVSGTVKEVEVRNNQFVRAGQVLFRLDPARFRLALDRANAQLATVRNDLEALKASYQNVQAEIAQAETDTAYFKKQFQRQEKLLRAHVTSRAKVDAAVRNFDSARQKLVALRHQLAGVAANLSGHPNEPVAQQPRYRAALAACDEARRNLDDTVVRAPFAGAVTNVSAIAPGKHMRASQTAFYLVSVTDVWVRADPKETSLTHVHAGQPATVTVDAYPNRVWHGTVASISPASAQEFSLLPAENTSGNWVKVVRRVPLRVRLQTSKSKPELRAGMSAEVAINTDHARGLPNFLEGIF